LSPKKGSDYFTGIRGIGPKKALTLIRKYKGLASVIVNERKNFNFSALTPELIKKVRKIILVPEINTQFDNILWNHPNKERAKSLMCEEHHLNKDRVMNNLEKLGRNYEKCRKFFTTNKKMPKKIQLTLD